MAIVLTTYTLLWLLYLPLRQYYMANPEWCRWAQVASCRPESQHNSASAQRNLFLWRTGQYIKIWRKGLKGSKGIQNYFLSLKRTFISVLPFFASSRKQILPRSPLGGDKKDEIKSTAWCWVVEMTEVMQGTRFLPQSSRPLSVFCWQLGLFAARDDALKDFGPSWPKNTFGGSLVDYHSEGSMHCVAVKSTTKNYLR